MLKDANFNSFAGVYIVCGYTDLRYGIDSLAAIIERKYKYSLFVPNTLFLFCGISATKSKDYFGKVMVFSFCIRGSSRDAFRGLVPQMNLEKCLLNNSDG